MLSHNLANYPKCFLGCVVTKGKICLQFGNVDVKLRYKEGAKYVKLPSCEKALPITSLGTYVNASSMGCPISVVFSMLHQTVDALVTYLDKHVPEKDRDEFIKNIDELSAHIHKVAVNVK